MQRYKKNEKINKIWYKTCRYDLKFLLLQKNKIWTNSLMFILFHEHHCPWKSKDVKQNYYKK